MNETDALPSRNESISGKTDLFSTIPKRAS